MFPLISISSFAVVPVGMWAKASISPLFELARKAWEAEPIVHIPTGFAVTEIIRGELAIGRGHSRYTLVFGRSCADLDHDAVMRIGVGLRA